jgi:phage tail sheath protein FI
MMESQPGVQISESITRPSSGDRATAVPVFIGYTERGEVQTLYSVETIRHYEDQLGREAPSSLRTVLFYTLRHYFDNGGGACFVLSVNNYAALGRHKASDIEADLTSAHIARAIAREPAITLLAVPELVLFSDDDVARFQRVWRAMLAICRRHTGLFALLDSPGAPSAAKACLNDFASADAAHGAAYWPRLVTTYVANQEARLLLPASGAIAAMVQRTDWDRGVWKAPANLALRNVTKPEYAYLDSDGLFNPDGASINLIRSFPGRGVRVWGCRTLTDEPESPWRYLQVRRLVSYIEVSLREIGRFVVFEPNNEITWLKLKGLARSWLRKLWLAGALYGTQEADAFHLAVGLDETMTVEDLKQGRMIMRIGVAVLHPAEFIKLNLVFDTGEGDSAESARAPNKSLLI